MKGPQRSDSTDDRPATTDSPDGPHNAGGRVLETPRQRKTVTCLLEHGTTGPVKMGALAERVAAREYGTTVADLEDGQRERVYVSLATSVLPKLDQHGLLEYDKSRGLVYPTDQLQRFRPHLSASVGEPTATANAGQ
ncbi:DUF7344 domain-containing protein [Natronosalvus caseinilyticus]|uniref:DUF7344 domain-containing protein n=1 Tax=Natronosalvus caseinilyticus TaxID=2953747 RepID=UPI0028A60E90|nr:hypothetical protein [Natronosalvus caseinilyticus]